MAIIVICASYIFDIGKGCTILHYSFHKVHTLDRNTSASIKFTLLALRKEHTRGLYYHGFLFKEKPLTFYLWMTTKPHPLLQAQGWVWMELWEANMALFHYFCHEKHKDSLPDHNGQLAKTVPSTSIAAANQCRVFFLLWVTINFFHELVQLLKSSYTVTKSNTLLSDWLRVIVVYVLESILPHILHM